MGLRASTPPHGKQDALLHTVTLPRIGTAGWALPRQWHDQFPTTGSHLERYAARFSAAEINSSFYRQHQRTTYQRWADAVPADFRFAVKVPKAITHDQTLVACDILLEVFLEDVTGLGRKLGPLLIQLPPSLEFIADHAEQFLTCVRALFGGQLAVEPRNATWFSTEVSELLRTYQVARVAADPARVPAAALPGGDDDLVYYRLHGSPRMYYSAYSPEYLVKLASDLCTLADQRVDTWCMFDNTTLGAATGDALATSLACAREPR
jgi:uncharacterized protein YecE (DUF72 family)